MTASVGKPQIDVRLAEDRRSLVVQYRNPAGVTLVLNLSPAEATDLCELLGACRSQALPEVPRHEAPAARTVVDDPPMFLQPATGSDHKLLLLRHPGFGWLRFALSAASARLLGEALVAASPGPQPEPPRKRQLH